VNWRRASTTSYDWAYPAHQCALWVRSGHFASSDQCPLYRRRRTLVERAGMSALCYKQTHAVQRKTDPRGQLYIRLPTASTRTCASHKSKIGGDQLVRPFATAPIDLGGNCINQVAV
jgi:hypothetical protein